MAPTGRLSAASTCLNKRHISRSRNMMEKLGKLFGNNPFAIMYLQNV